MDIIEVEKLYNIVCKIVRKNLQEMGKTTEFENLFVDEIIDYIFDDTPNRIERFYKNFCSNSPGRSLF